MRLLCRRGDFPERRLAAGIGAVREHDDRAGADLGGLDHRHRRLDGVVDVRAFVQGRRLGERRVDLRLIRRQRQHDRRRAVEGHDPKLLLGAALCSEDPGRVERRSLGVAAHADAGVDDEDDTEVLRLHLGPAGREDRKVVHGQAVLADEDVARAQLHAGGQRQHERAVGEARPGLGDAEARCRCRRRERRRRSEREEEQ